LLNYFHADNSITPRRTTKVKKYPRFLNLLSNKVVGGSSAGACLFSTRYWYCREMCIYNGLAVLPAAIFVHRGSEEFNATEDKLEDFKKQTEDLELVALEECEWVEKIFDCF